MNDIQCAFRFPADLVARLDAYAAKLSRDGNGIAVTRADAVRVCCVLQLDKSRVRVPPKKRKTKRKRAAK